MRGIAAAKAWAVPRLTLLAAPEDNAPPSREAATFDPEWCRAPQRSTVER